MNEYIAQANNFLEKTGASISVEYLETKKYFPDDQYPRDIYTVTLARNDRSYTFKFGQSLQCSGKWWKYKDYRRGISTSKSKPFPSHEWDKNPDYELPNAYDILAAMTIYDPESFEDFCCSFGYSDDSIKALEIYKAVTNEFENLQRLFSDKELEELQEIG